ncbi:hypothetical protein PHMEG_00033246 [Phytophthora megakarya]|uniref:Uncharacterized protein n=1 Tax=Phytophthora megakarya TaxID=4795 RepID=A0A225UU65_9STRA|nr:hypothetical protein PHMEG_00033246 [Phytophthora megakarya]
MDAHDRVCSMLQRERFRSQYRVNKVTIKMLYFEQPRTVLHDDGQWGGAEPAPRFSIRQAAQLHQVLWVIQDAAMEWYPADVVAVFRAVHAHAIHDVPGTAPRQDVQALCNLYQTVFGHLHVDIFHGIPSRDLDARALPCSTRLPMNIAT